MLRQPQVGDGGHRTEGTVNFPYSSTFWRRYVDDTCTILPGDLVDSFHSHLNSIDNNIQFTVEKESDRQLPFLDILLTSEEDVSVSTSVYRKTTHTDQYLNFESHHPTAHKRAVVKTLLHRADALSSSGVSRAEEEKHMTNALQRMVIPLVSSADTPFQPSPAKYRTAVVGVHH